MASFSFRYRHGSPLQSEPYWFERRNIELQRFAYLASHDLQTPLRSTASFVALVRSGYADNLDARGADWLRRIADATRVLQSLVRDLLDYTRADSRVAPFEKVPFREIVDSVLALLDAGIRATGKPAAW